MLKLWPTLVPARDELRVVRLRVGGADEDRGHEARKSDRRPDAGRGHQGSVHPALRCPADGAARRKLPPSCRQQQTELCRSGDFLLKDLLV